MIIECGFCDETIFQGEDVLIDKGCELHSCGYDGEFEEGSGECKECGKMYCMDCGKDGLCSICQEEEESIAVQ